MILLLLLSIFTASANPPITWGGSTTAQLFPTIQKTLLGSGMALVPTRSLFGDCSDGDVTISTNTTLTSDIFYNNLTINSGAILFTAGYRVFVCGTLDLTAAGFIYNSGNAGGNGGAGTGAGGGGAAGTVGTMNRGATGIAGGAGSTNNGVAAATGIAQRSLSGTNGGAGGAGGSGTGTGGAGGGTVVATPFPWEDFLGFSLPQLGDTTVVASAVSGSGGGGGGGNGATNGSGGGGGGAGGGPVFVSANKILTGPSTSLGAIQSGGGTGGNGGSPTGTCIGAGCGGGGGGGGGAGGYVVVRFNSKSGTVVFLTYAGGGAAGTGGTGKNGTNGTNGTAGGNGLIYHVDLSTGTITRFSGGLGAI